ncbi:retention module-containing protein [Chitinibacter sp. SCUT-21]|uniref:retention module-containing protein n=1 Tax=Chitinibacter sp. SCUT-21 TaxID=2970891 RepID=UPI0035A57776
MAVANTTTKAVSNGANAISQKGVASQVIGEVKVIAANGEERVLRVGDKLNPGDTIQTGADGAVSITFDNGSQISLGHADSLLLSEQVLAELIKPATSAADDAARIQELIAQGADPTQIAAATAAGAGGTEDGGHSFVVLDTPQSRVDIPTGIDTTGIDTGATLTLAEPPQSDVVANTPPAAINDNSTGAADDGLSTNEDSVLTINPATLLGNDVDVDGDPLTITSVQDAINGTVALINGQVIFTPNPDYNGPASFTYTVDDGNGGTDTATVNITVTPVNDVPDAKNDNSTDAANDALTTKEDTALNIIPATLLANDVDPDGDTLTITSVQGAVNGMVALVNGEIVFTPAKDYNGPASFTYTVDDGNGGTDTATVNITVTPVNDVPDAKNDNSTDAANDALTTKEDIALNISPATLLANDVDPDGDTLTITSVQGAVNGTVALVDGQIVFTPVKDYNGPASFTYTVDDGNGGTDTATVNITVTPVNDVPDAKNDNSTDAANDALTTKEDTALNIIPATLLANDVDPDGDTLTITSVQGAVNGMVALVNGEIVFTPAKDYNGPASFTYTVDDGNGGTDTATVNITVTPVNDVPDAKNDNSTDAANDALTTKEDIALNISPATLLANDVDPDGDTLTITSVQGAVNGTVALVDGQIVFTPVKDYNGPASFTYTVDDGNGGTDTATVNITVTPVNDVPDAKNDNSTDAANDALTTKEDIALNISPATLLANDVDPDGDTLTITSVQGAVNGTVALVDGQIVFTPAKDYNGPASFTYTVDDGKGGSDTASVNINVTPMSDAAIIAGDDEGSVKEDVNVVEGQISVGGQLTISDADTDESVFIPQTNTTHANGYGSFSVDSDGTWRYTADNSQAVIQRLDDDETLSETFTVVSVDGASVEVVITINGTNDAPVPTAATLQVTEGGSLATGQLIATDVDIETLTFALASEAPVAGLVINNNGSFSFDPSNSAYDYLKAGEKLTLNVPYTVTDGTETVASTLTITITGTNDGAVIGGDDEGSVKEDVNVVEGQISVGGQLTISDADTDESVFIPQTNTTHANGYGSFSVDSDGTWRYTADNSQAVIQRLDDDETLSETFTVVSVDGASVEVVITINGTNDAPVPTAATLQVTEGGSLATGQLIATDVDIETLTFALASEAPVAGLVINNNGSFSFDPSNSAYDYLKAGEKLTLNVPYTVTDGTETVASTLTITITGTNDGAVIGGDDEGSVKEDVNVVEGQISVGGQLTISDADTDESVFIPQTNTTHANGYGSFSVDSDGTWRYTADNSQAVIQRLDDDETLSETFTVVSVDGASVEVVITINGTNDAPVPTAATLQVTEGGSLATGQLIATDVDIETLTFALASEAPVAGLVINNNGSFSFDPSNSAYDYLKAGEKLTLNVPYTVTDGTETVASTLTITITGTNDGAVIGGDDEGSVKEDVNVVEGQISVGGQLTISDADTDESVFIPQTNTTHANGYGSFSVDSDGTWRYTADNSQAVIQRLDDDETLSETFTVVSVDGASVEVVITINGTNDAPVPTAATLQVTEGGSLATGQLIATDVDIETLTFALASEAPVAGLVINNNGSFSFDPSNSAYDYLKAGEKLTLNVPYTVTDGTETVASTLTITITGTNDGAVIGGDDEGSVKEDVNVVEGQISVGGQLTISDADTDESVFIPQTNTTHANGYGSFSVDSDGTWRYTADNSQAVIQRLDDDETLSETFTVVSVDGASVEVVITINGTNDAPVPTAATLQVTEGGSLATGQLIATDVDIETLTFALASEAPVAGLVINNNGSFSFDPSNSAYDYLKAGEKLTLNVPYTVTDGTETVASTLTITITGTNDGAVIGGDDEGSVKEDVNVVEGQISVGGQLTISDADTDESVFIPQTNTTHANGYGSFSVDSDGTWRYTADNSQAVIQRLDDDETLSETFTVVSVDGASVEVVITINGTNDAPVPTAATLQVTEGGSLATGQLIATDVDIETLTFALASEAPVAGLVINNNGSFSFDPSNSAYDYLKAGEKLTLNVPYTVTDGTETVASTLTITITGTNDGAVIGGDDEGSVKEDVNVVEGQISVGGQLTISDADTDESVFIPQTNTTHANGYGSFSVDSDGTWRYTADNSQAVIQRLDDDETLSETFTVVSVDGASVEVVITINGTNDAPVPTAATLQVTEGGSLATGQLIATDVDIETLTFALASEAPVAGLVINNNGSFSFDPSNSAYDYLKAGEKLTLNVPYTVTDGTETVASTLTITITGTNDGAVIGGDDEGSVKEDVNVVEGQISVGGQLTISDADTDESVFIPQTNTTHANGYGSFSVDSDGTWHYTADNSQAVIQRLDDDETLSETFTVVSVDGASVNVVVTINGTNDRPTITTNIGNSADIVAEAWLSTGSHLGSINTRTAEGSFSLGDQDGLDDIRSITIGGKVFTFGVAGVGEVHINSLSDLVGKSIDTPHGTLSISENDSANGVFTYTYELKQSVLNTTPASTSFDEVVTISVSDGTLSNSANISITINDDAPFRLAPEITNIVDHTSGVDSFTGGLNFFPGADGIGSVTFTFVESTLANPVFATDTNGNQLYLGAEKLYLHYEGSDHSVLKATTSASTGGTEAFRIDIDPNTNQYTLTLGAGVVSNSETISATSSTLSTVGGGNSEYKTMVNVSGSTLDVLLSAGVGHTANTSNSDIGVDQGQTIEAGEHLRYDFIKDLASTVSSTGPSYTSHMSISSFTQIISINGKGVASFTLSAINSDNDNQFIGDTGDTSIALSINDIVIRDATNAIVSNTGHVTENGGLVTLTGLADDWTFTVSSSTPFNALQIDGATGTDTFALGLFTIQTNPTNIPIDLNYGIIGKDSDGDSISSNLLASLYPVANTLEGTSSGDTLTANTASGSTPAHPYVFGYAGNDVLNGDSNDNILVGGDGNDLLKGGGGNDILNGGNGSDTFVFNNLSNNGADLIQDFTVKTVTTGGDVLDITDLLSGANLSNDGGAFSGNEGAFLQFTEGSNIGDVNVMFDADGTGAGAAVQVATLTGMGTTDPSTLLNTLLDNGEIKTSH